MFKRGDIITPKFNNTYVFICEHKPATFIDQEEICIVVEDQYDRFTMISSSKFRTGLGEAINFMVHK